MNRYLAPLIVSILFGALSTISLISWYQKLDHTLWIVIVFTFVVFSLLGFRMFISIRNNPAVFLRNFKRLPILMFGTIFSFILLWSLKDPSAAPIQGSFFIGSVVLVISYLTLFLIVCWLLISLSNISIVRKYTKVPKWKIVAYALLPIICWSIYLVAYFPGTMTPDSLLHWEQIHTLDFSNWHPVVYTWYIMFLTSIWKSPAIVAFSQIVILALFGGYAAYSIEKSGISTKWVWMGVVLFSIYPLNGIFPIAIWKDIFFSGLLFLFTVMTYNIVASNGKWLNSNVHLILLGLTALATSLMRTNGLPITLVTAILLLVAYRKQFLKIVITTVSVLILYFVITGPFYTYMDVRPSSPNEALSIPTQQFAHIISEDGDLTAEERQYLGEILPLEIWKENYNPYLTNPIKFDGHYDQEVIFDDFGYYLSTWASVVSKNFSLAVEAYLHQTSILWQINQPEDGYTSTYARNVYLYNDYDLKTDPLSKPVYNFVNRGLESLQNNLLEPLLRPAFYTAIILLSGVVLALRNGAKSLLVITPLLINTGVMLLATPAQDFRYQFANVLVTFFVVGILFIKFESKEKKVRHE
ncbi:hypothetical protein SAMN04487936_10894 [Halobacillus dabanensis]|uniref:Dolichyl-phosphate-mannose-protein mannosyltransferase n=1 Tax=Halobacillus dabanensis TaxID=240302 RepID=A0A1I3XC07_HALDA|nr:DUF6020 family protein [Halobacillus dabanensis]SFK16581.1 hypothetical protein SAMN04487936_10894 [Halobacillus dabanensis]